ncbi:MAG: FAD-binding domain-containing protein, partial [Micrococcaceae bacterium]|nr:FAD-binding domain-containing protein [Micrococcaceae bacterium]
FRVFNPELQAKKFDPRGTYVSRFAPLPSPDPVVDLKVSRAAALESYAQMKERP